MLTLCHQTRYTSAMASSPSPLQNFQALLEEMLQTEKSDLHFGIYRVVSARGDDIRQFIQNTIPEAVQRFIQEAQPVNDAIAEKEALERDIRKDHGSKAFTSDGDLNPIFAEGELGDKWRKICRRVQDAKPLHEEEIYNRLLQFFSRYYEGGDFVSKRRYGGQERYAVPYDGREVLLHWANRDQYYIKTADRYAQYAFRVGRRVFQFIAEAPAQKDNNKPAKGLFILTGTREENGRILAVFERRKPSVQEEKDAKRINGQNGGDIQSKLITLAEQCIAEDFPALAPLLETQADQDGKSLFAIHAARFVRRSTSDFFIHRNLRAFLRRELDFFLKNDVINADELAESVALENRFAVFRAVRAVARKVIDFLAQWEDFQKSLWEKKKFVLQTEYCATLGRIPEWKKCGVLDDIADCDKQWAEWEALGMLGENLNGKDKREKRIAFLKNNPSLPVDTVNFLLEFKDKLLSQFSDLDEVTDGVLFHGDNWQALNLIGRKYYGRVKCIYIDPPYNSPSSEIIYKNSFKHSSWLSLMENRVALSGAFLSQDGVFVCAVDENEMLRLGMMLDGVFPDTEYERNCLTVLHNPKGIQGGFVSINNEYAFVVSRIGQVANTIPIPEEEWEWENFRNWGGESERHAAKNCFYPIVVKNGEIIGFGDVCRDDFHPQQNESGEDGSVLVYPIDKDGVERKWTYARQSISKIERLLRAVPKNGGIDIERTHDWRRFKTVWCDKEYIAGDHGSKPLNKILGRKLFDFPKSIPLVMDFIRMAANDDSVMLDYFAGSGTSAHAIINLNREDNGCRKFALVEMGDHFNTVLLPRIKKVIYSPEWKAGKASRPATEAEYENGPRLVKYQRIESYEDALDNVEFKDDSVQRTLDDFVPRYMLQWESKESSTFLSDEMLENPFDYTLRLSGETPRTERADIPETFAYLVGMRVKTRRVLFDKQRCYLVCAGECEGAEAVSIWRDISNWKDKDFEQDRDFIAKQNLAPKTSTVWINGNSLVPGAMISDLTLRERMFAPPPGAEQDEE